MISSPMSHVHASELQITPGFATSEECAGIMEGFARAIIERPRLERRIEIPGKRLRHTPLPALRLRVCQTLEQRAEYTLVSAMFPGDHHPLHADAEKRQGDEWVPNHTPHRSGVALIYLTGYGAGFTGGLLRLPSVGLEIEPEPGMLVAFPSGRLYEHEVTPVLTGVRYAVAIWMTRIRERYEQWNGA
jgi:hypothetical protein